MRTGPLRPADRAPLAELLVATRAFNADEVQVALSLFDLAMAPPSAASAAVEPPAASPAVEPPAASAAVDLMDYEFIGAFDRERLVGYACFGQTPSTDRTYDLYWLAVHPSVQGRGAGRALVGEVERTLAARGARMLVAETSGRPDYAGTRAFYLATGYAEAARVTDFYAPADDRIMLNKRLTNTGRGVATR